MPKAYERPQYSDDDISFLGDVPPPSPIPAGDKSASVQDKIRKYEQKAEALALKRGELLKPVFALALTRAKRAKTPQYRLENSIRTEFIDVVIKAPEGNLDTQITWFTFVTIADVRLRVQLADLLLSVPNISELTPENIGKQFDPDEHIHPELIDHFPRITKELTHALASWSQTR